MKFDYNLKKNQNLRLTRGANFEDVIKAVKDKQVIKDLEHHNQIKHPNQRLLIVKINNYVYVAPYINDKTKGVKFLKTVYPNRKLTEKYLKK